MPSPFPGMDPYLEGAVWPDVHHRLATEISDRLMPMLRPRYVARIEIHNAIDEDPSTEIGIVYPDVGVHRAEPRDVKAEDGRLAPAATPATLLVPLFEVEVRLSRVNVIEVSSGHLVTAIEIVSPVNKHEPGRTAYVRKLHALRRAGIHVLEIDLLRRGRRSLSAAEIPATSYRMALMRSGTRSSEIWTVGLRDPLPTLPVPLRGPDPDVSVNLGAALGAIYDRAAYDCSVDYTVDPPPPTLSDDERTWVRGRIGEYGRQIGG